MAYDSDYGDTQSRMRPRWRPFGCAFVVLVCTLCALVLAGCCSTPAGASSSAYVTDLDNALDAVDDALEAASDSDRQAALLRVRDWLAAARRRGLRLGAAAEWVRTIDTEGLNE